MINKQKAEKLFKAAQKLQELQFAFSELAGYITNGVIFEIFEYALFLGYTYHRLEHKQIKEL